MWGVRRMSGSVTLTLVIGGPFSIAVAIVTGVIANLNARTTPRFPVTEPDPLDGGDPGAAIVKAGTG
jgi:hypothetical protein